MSVHLLPLAEQAEGAFDGGRILENKPIGFPQDSGGMRPFSTLFYWAHAWSDEGGLIAEHPHQGFEIVSFVLSGEIEHYDNKARDWKKLKTGDVQIIRSGRGITHAERLLPGSSMFQIWFDPDLSKAMQKDATYTDYRLNEFPERTINGAREVTMIGPGSPFQLDAKAAARRYNVPAGNVDLPLDESSVTGFYVMRGNGELGGEKVGRGDFVVVVREKALVGSMAEDAELFAVEVPGRVPYPLYIDRFS